uniref:Ysc84 actin-binding domain-containing protein n=1 Tax=Solibacter usitatus (strain Ellin6076) TaxID=234267 RepID=Q01WM0_SOLUE
MKIGKLCLIGVIGVSTGSLYGREETAATRLRTASEVVTEVMSAPDRGIPQELLEKAQCIVIVPGLKKAAFIVGGKYGRGFISCRANGGTGWSSPAGVKVEGGSFGFQIGGSETDVVMLVMNKRGAEKLLSSKFTLGADASVAAGPVGRTAAADTDLKMQAEILTYSRARGVFAGIALNGATLRPDKESNVEIYGAGLTNRQIVMGGTHRSPVAAEGLTANLNRFSAHKE